MGRQSGRSVVQEGDVDEIGYDALTGADVVHAPGDLPDGADQGRWVVLCKSRRGEMRKMWTHNCEESSTVRAPLFWVGQRYPRHLDYRRRCDRGVLGKGCMGWTTCVCWCRGPS